MNPHRLLLVDDEPNILKVLSTALNNRWFTCKTAQNGEEALEKLRSEHFDMVISDFKMPGMNGEELMIKAKTLFPELSFVLVTAYGTIESAVNAMRKGAYTYLTKPVDLELLENVVREALQKDTAEKPFGPDSYQFRNIVGNSPAMQEVFSLIRRVSTTDANILVLGESGTGKELVARAIHYSSLRKDHPFMPIDCTTIPSELMESELFGHEKGSFTNASERKIGLLEMAQKGTVFLDEIGDLDIALEKKLLRFLQEKEILRVGGKKRILIDVRIVSATNRDIEKEVEEGSFRADLYYRLNVITIRMPPLRERCGDVELLAEHYLNHFNWKNKKVIKGIDREVLRIFTAYDWPGNVRELENVMERAVILCPFDTINIECLPQKMKCIHESNRLNLQGLTLPEMERKIIMNALDLTSWNQSRAAATLGISRKQLRTKMKNHGLLESE